MNAIEFENISKQYRLGKIGTGTISHDLNRWWAQVRGKEDPYLKVGQVNDRTKAAADGDYVWALKDITFNIEQGDVVGIIGRNGAGKSTLLKILSKVTTPSTGIIKSRGRIASLLEVGTGFHPEMSGRENIYMNGSIMGMTRREITRKLDEIVDFAGIAKYLDTPTKRYSSGMTVRLGFAIAAFLEPEILVVDEVLAVGDAEFQKKAIGKMQDVSQGEGRTVLFVSHNMTAIQQLCKTGVLLDNGYVSFIGTSNDVVTEYLREVPTLDTFDGVDGDEDFVYISYASVKSSNNDKLIYTSSEINIKLNITVNHKFTSLKVGFNVYSEFGHPICRANYNDVSMVRSLEKGLYELIFSIPSNVLSSGLYKIKFDVAEPRVKRYNTQASDITFEVVQDISSGNITADNRFILENSIVKMNWLKEIKRYER